MNRKWIKISPSDMAHIAESTHWYDSEGNPAYEVRAKNGNMRPTTSADARKLNLVPSVTSIIKCAAAPGLERWKQNQVLLSALTLPRNEGEPETEWLQRVMRDSQEQGKKAAERGTMIHAAIQGHYEGKQPSDALWPHVRSARNAVKEWTDGSWLPERSFCHGLGYGGKVDLSCDTAVLDFKTKEFTEQDDLVTWDEHAMQLAAYREGLGIPEAKCAIVYVSVSVPGLSRLIEIEEDKLTLGWQMFRGLLNYWQAKNKYWPNLKEAV